MRILTCKENTEVETEIDKKVLLWKTTRGLPSAAYALHGLACQGVSHPHWGTHPDLAGVPLS